MSRHASMTPLESGLSLVVRFLVLPFECRWKFSVVCMKSILLKPALLEYYLRLSNETQRSIERALELGYEDDGSMHIRLARTHMRNYKVDTPSVKCKVPAALEAFRSAFSYADVA